MADDARARAGRRAVCPVCHHPVPAPDAPSRPFCSRTCRLVDLGAWLDEAHRLPGPPLSAEPDDPDDPR